jgi:hypothetical protein
MESKPYSIQSPEQIAKDYGGNKQKIAEAMQMGVVDPTAGTLAGMFIDRMRSAAQQEQAPQQTVAQQVFAPPAPPAPMGGAPAGPNAPSGPPAPMGAPSAGLGATPEAAQVQLVPPMPEAPQPEMSDEEAPVGMAEGGMVPPYASGGGLSDVPIPAGMFDEPDNGGYANGGLVAFARGGGMSNLYDSVEYWESGGKQSATSPKGARGVMQLMNGTSRDPGFGIEPTRNDSEEENRRVGQQYLDAMYRRYGDQATALAAYNWGPGNVDKWLKSGADPKKLPTETQKYISNVMKGDAPPIRERNAATAQGFTAGLGDIADLIERRFAKSPEDQATDDAMRARAKELASPEYEAKQRKDSMWETLAAIGFNMASSKTPNLLQAVGEAASAALPGAIADKKERKQLKDKALNLMVEMGAKDRREALDKFKLAVDVQQQQLAQQQFGQKLELDKEQLDLKRQELEIQTKAAEAKGYDPTDIAFRMFMSGNPEAKAAASEWLQLNHPASGTGTDAAERTRELLGGRGGTGAGSNVIDFSSLKQPK